MVTIHSLHLLVIGIIFIAVSQILFFEEGVLSLMLFIGVVLAVSGAYFRIVRTIGLRVKKAINKTEPPKQEYPKNYNLTYFLVGLLVAFIVYGYMTMTSIF